MLVYNRAVSESERTAMDSHLSNTYLSSSDGWGGGDTTPSMVQYHISTDPDGIAVTYHEGQTYDSAFVVEGESSNTYTVSVPDEACLEGQVYTFY